jgi:putative salt-induced outer membrane protein YdiY
VKSLIAVLSLFPLIVATAAHADVVYLKNGDRVTGEIKEIWDEKISIEPIYADEFDIDLEDVASVSTDGVFDIELYNDIEGEYTLVQSELPGQVILREGEGEISLALIDLKRVEEVEEFFEWDAKMDLNQTLSRGDTDSFTGNLNADLELKWGDHRTDYVLSVIREEIDGAPVKDIKRFNAGYNFIFSDPWYLAIDANIERDPIALLDRRVSINPGVGYDIYDNPGQLLQVQLGAGWQNEIIDDVEEEGTVIDWRLTWERDFFDGDFEMFHKQNIYKNLAGRENLVINTQTGFRYEITDDIYINTQLNYDTDSNPAEDTSGENINLVFGAGLKF